MAKDPKTPERYVVEAMYMAIGTLKAFRTDGNGVQDVIITLENAIAKFDPRCDHDFEAALHPAGGIFGTCRKCGVTRYTQ